MTSHWRTLLHACLFRITRVRTDLVMNAEPDFAAQLFEAIKNIEIQKVDEILSSGAVNVEVRNTKEKNRTPLHIAALYGRDEIATLLVDKYKADVNSKDSDNKIPLQLATDYYRMKIVKFLIQRNSSLKEYAARHLNTPQVEELFEAAHANNINKIEELLNSGVDVDSEDRSDYNRTILEVAANNGNYDLVKLLVDTYGADIQHEDDGEESAYHKAAIKKYDNIANFLLERGFINTFEDEESRNARTVSLNEVPT